MPNYTKEQITQQLKDCNKALDNLFLGLQLTPEFQRQINAIKLFYTDAIENAVETDNTHIFEATYEEYQKLITIFSDVKSGSLSKENALECIEETTNKRVNHTIFENILNACQLLFWVAIGFGSYAACSMVGIPLLILNPGLGALLITGTSLGFLAGMYKTIACCFDFKSSTPIYEEDKRNNAVISFFKPKRVVNAAQHEGPPGGLRYEPLDELRTDGAPIGLT